MRRSAIVTSAAFMLATLTTGGRCPDRRCQLRRFPQEVRSLPCLEGASRAAGDLPDPIRSDQEGLVGPRQESEHQGRARRRLQANERSDEGGDDGLRLRVLTVEDALTTLRQLPDEPGFLRP